MYRGQDIKRVENRRLLTSGGRYVDDIHVPDAAYAVFMRSPHAHTVIKEIETGLETSMPDVLAALTAADWRASGGGDLPCIQTVVSSTERPRARYGVLCSPRIEFVMSENPSRSRSPATLGEPRTLPKLSRSTTSICPV